MIYNLIGSDLDIRNMNLEMSNASRADLRLAVASILVWDRHPEAGVRDE